MKFLLLFLFCGFLCYGQTRENKLTKISYPTQKELYPKGYWDTWVVYLEKAENTINSSNIPWHQKSMEHFNRFLLYAKMQTNSSEELLSVFEDAYNFDKHYVCHQFDKVFPLNGKEYEYLWKMYVTEKPTMDSLCQKVRNNYSEALVAKVKEIEEKDQRYRGLIGKKTLEELKSDGSWQKQLEFDETNSKEVEHILTKIGYPGRSKVGYENEAAVFLVIQHSNLELMEKSLPMILRAVENHDLKASYYPYLHDRIKMLKNEPQSYGTQRTLEGELYKLENPENVNERRSVYGLPKLE